MLLWGKLPNGGSQQDYMILLGESGKFSLPWCCSKKIRHVCIILAEETITMPEAVDIAVFTLEITTSESNPWLLPIVHATDCNTFFYGSEVIQICHGEMIADEISRIKVLINNR